MKRITNDTVMHEEKQKCTVMHEEGQNGTVMHGEDQKWYINA